MSKYTNGANFERKVIHYLMEKGALFVMRGAGSKSYGNIKADIVAFANNKVLIIQVKHSDKTSKKEEEEFMSNVTNELGNGFIPLWLTPKNWKELIDLVL
ncbi:MAG: hypothetical protein ACP5LI_07670 [Hydrogenobaculum sp.]